MPDLQSVWSSDEKYEWVIHAEVNAVHKALKSGVDVTDCILYCTHLPCKQCMKTVVAAAHPAVVVYDNDIYNSCTDDVRAYARTVCSMLNIKLYSLYELESLREP